MVVVVVVVIVVVVVVVVVVVIVVVTVIKQSLIRLKENISSKGSTFLKIPK